MVCRQLFQSTFARESGEMKNLQMQHGFSRGFLDTYVHPHAFKVDTTPFHPISTGFFRKQHV